MKRVVLFIFAILLCLYSTQLLASSESIVARLGFGDVYGVKFLPDGRVLAIASEYGVYLYDPLTFSQMAYLGPTSRVESVAFSPDGGMLAGGSFGGVIELWDIKSRTTLIATLEGHTGSVESVSFSPDGSLLASGSDDSTIRLWDAKSRKGIATLRGHTWWVESVAFSPDGSLLASGSQDKTIRLWDVKSGTEIATLRGHTRYVKSVTFSPDGSLLASGSADGTIKLWDVKSRTNIATLWGGGRSVTFSPDGGLLASGSFGGVIELWDIKSRTTLIATLEGHTHRVDSVTFSPDGSLLASGSYDDTIRLWDVKSRANIATLGRTGSGGSISFSPDGGLLASGSWGDTIMLWDVKSRKEIATLEGHTGSVNSVSFSPDGSLLASGSDDSTIRLWDAKSRKGIATLEGHAYSVRSVTFSPDGRLLASGSWREIKLWDVKGGTEIATLEGHAYSVRSVAFSPDGRLLASGSDDSTIKLWDVANRNESATLWGHTDWVRSVAFSPDGRLLASGSDDNTIKLWDVKSRANIATLRHTGVYTRSVNSVTFSPDGGMLASGSGDNIGSEGSRHNTIKLWDVKSRKEIATLEGHPRRVLSVTFSPDGIMLASGSWDGTIILWDMKPYIQGPVNKPPVVSFAISHQEPYVNTEIAFDASASSDPDGRIVSWAWDFGDGAMGEGMVVKHTYLSAGQWTVTLKVTDDANATATASKQVLVSQDKIVEESSKLRTVINTKLYQKPIYPPYLLDTSSFGSAVNTIWQNINDWFRRNDLTDNYNELYYTGIEYDNMRFGALIKARDFLDNGNIENAKRFLDKADAYEKMSYLSFQGASYVFEANLEVAKTIAESIKDGCQASVRFGLKFVSPTAAEVADIIYDLIDFGIECHIGDKTKATKDLLIKLSINKLFNEVNFKDLGDKTISDWTQNRAGKYLFPTLCKITKSQEWQGAVSKVIKEIITDIPEGKLTKVLISITDSVHKAMNSIEVRLKSPAEIRVYDSQGRVTGLFNGELRNEIPSSMYDSETVTVFFPEEDYHYEVIGKDSGKYGLEVTITQNSDVTVFNAVEIPISTSAVHQYSIDWDSLTSDSGVTFQIDDEGDGVFDTTITSGETLIGSDIAKVVCVKGDVDLDGVIGSKDALLALKISVGLIEPTPEQLCAADMNDDGVVSSGDAILILHKSAGLLAPKFIGSQPAVVNIMLGEMFGIVGESISVPLKVDNSDGLAGGDIRIAYDGSVLRVVDISTEVGMTIASNMSESGIIRISFAGLGTVFHRTLAKIQFTVLDDRFSPLEIKSARLYRSDAQPIEANKTDGKFTSWAIAPEKSALLQNYPNPFNPETWIPYQLKEGSDVAVRIYSSTGELVRKFELGYKPAGLYFGSDRAVYWDGRNSAGEHVASGVYFYTIQAGGYNATKKMIILR